MDYFTELVSMLKLLDERELKIIYYTVKTILEGRGR